MILTTRELGNRAVLKLHGTISGANSVRLSKALLDVGKGECSEIILDLEHVEYIDSPGLGGIIYAQIKLEKSNKKIILSGPHSYVNKLFRDCALDKKFQIIESCGID